MDEDRWLRTVRTDDVDGVAFTEARGPDGPVLLTRLPDGEVVAFEPRCPHTRQPLRRGELTAEGCIECPVHFYRYDARTGRNVFPAIDATDGPLTLYRTREVDGWIEVGGARERAAS